MSLFEVLATVAAKYNIEIELLPKGVSLYRIRTRRDIQIGSNSGYAIDSTRKAILLERDQILTERPILDIIEHEPEVFFHEMVHLICQPPTHRIDDVGEAWMLLQFERQLARHLSQKYALPALYSRVADWQDVTALDIYIDGVEYPYISDLKETGTIERREFWRAGLRRARAIGLLDKKNTPTFRLPDWKAIKDQLTEGYLDF